MSQVDDGLMPLPSYSDELSAREGFCRGDDNFYCCLLLAVTSSI